MALLQQQQDCGHGKMPWLWPKQDCGHDKTVAMERLRPWHYYCSHGKTAAMTLLQQQQDCGHDTTAAMARLCPWQDAMAAAKAGLQPWHYCSCRKTMAMA